MKPSFSRRLVVLGLLVAFVGGGFLWRNVRESASDVRQVSRSAAVNPKGLGSSAKLAAAAGSATAASKGLPASGAPSGAATFAMTPLWFPVGLTQGVKLEMNPAASFSRGVSGATSGRSLRVKAAPASALADLHPGESVVFPLPGGDEATGRINLVQADAGGWLRVGGELTGDRHGTFTLNSSGDDVGGMVLLPREGLALVLAKQTDGSVTMVETPIGEVLCIPMPKGPVFAGESGAEPPPVAEAVVIPILSSRPNATAVIYLDFDGETVTDPRWNGGQTIVAAAPNVTASDINQIWASVKEDYWAFNIDVTTDLNRYNNAPVNRRTRCIVTPTDTAAPGSGGVAYINCFSRAGGSTFSSTIPCWVFVGGAKPIAEAAAHEVGHTLGLRHDGRTGEEYYAGHGSGAVGWAPIMGVGYYRSLVQWSRGEYPNASNTEDDIAIISSTTNGFGFVADEAGNTTATAAALNVSGTAINQSGIITRNTDTDFYRFTVGAGSALTVAATPASYAPDLDILIELQDANGMVLASANPDTALDATLTASLSPGTYYLKVVGTGRGSVSVDGYSNYGSIGSYTLTGTIVGAAQAPTISGLTDVAAASGQSSAPMSFTVADADTSVNSLTLTGASSNPGLVPNANISFGGGGASRTVSVLPSVGQTGTATITVTVSDGALSASGSFSVTVSAPVISPVFTLNPVGQTVTVGGSASFSANATGTPAPTYQWLKNGAPISGATGASYSISAVTLADAGSYAVVASNAGGNVTSSSAILTVNNGGGGTLLAGTPFGSTPWRGLSAWDKSTAFDGNPATAFDSEDPFIYVGLDFGAAKTIQRIRFLPRATLNARMLGGQFRVANNSDLSDAVTIYTISSVPPDGVWQDVTLPVAAVGYRYLFYTTDGPGHGNVAELEFYGTGTVTPPPPPPVPPQITGQPQSQTVTEGNPVSFTVTTNVSVSYQWLKNNSPIGGATAATYSIAAATLTDAGSYSVVVTSPGGSVPSAAAVLTVQPRPSGSGILSGTPFGSTPWHGLPAWNHFSAFDGNPATAFDSEDAFIYVGLDFGAARTIDRIRFLPRSTLNFRMLGGQFRAANSPDLSDAVTIYTITSIPPDGVWQDVTLPASTNGYRYVFFTTNSDGHGNVAELEFYGAAVAGSSVLSGTPIGTTPWHGLAAWSKTSAFDGDPTTAFDSEDAFIYVGLDFGTPKTVSRIRYLPRATLNARMVGGQFRVANSPNLSDAVTIHTVTSVPPDGVWQTVVLPAPVSGWRYIFFTTDSAGHGNVAELEFIGP